MGVKLSPIFLCNPNAPCVRRSVIIWSALSSISSWKYNIIRCVFFLFFSLLNEFAQKEWVIFKTCGFVDVLSCLHRCPEDSFKIRKAGNKLSIIQIFCRKTSELTKSWFDYLQNDQISLKRALGWYNVCTLIWDFQCWKKKHVKVVLVKSLLKEAKNEFNNVTFRERNLSVYVIYISCSPVSLVFRN